MNCSGSPKILVFNSVAEMAEVFARDMANAVRRAVAEKGVFALALTGGNTPRPLYGRLAGGDIREAAPWDKVKVFFGDERAVGPDHPDSNYGMARNAWLGLGLIPPGQIHRMEGDAEDLEAAAVRYEQILRRELPPAASGPVGFPSFDLVLLGIGEDGHIASLFPGTRALYETQRAVVVNDVPQQAARRLTLTYPAINAAREVWFLATGTHKARCVAQALGQAQGGWALPVSCVHPAGGRICWWLDKAAASNLAADCR